MKVLNKTKRKIMETKYRVVEIETSISLSGKTVTGLRLKKAADELVSIGLLELTNKRSHRHTNRKNISTYFNVYRYQKTQNKGDRK